MNERKNKYIFYSSSTYMPYSSVGKLHAILETPISEQNTIFALKRRNQSKNSTNLINKITLKNV